ncbi:hypothetical protein L3X37_07605 [Sabulilitoribacter arenilitoris]|uniref:Uncharacterized protein n=1 Tax=Wocania arenilitoris TaxID=2044858 RepID=A0AAE3ENU0_9FLAO|nr:hypothetical protein [Wocania arenilitoris]
MSFLNLLLGYCVQIVDLNGKRKRAMVIPKKFFTVPIAEFGIDDCLKPKFLKPKFCNEISQSVFAFPAAVNNDL